MPKRFKNFINPPAIKNHWSPSIQALWNHGNSAKFLRKLSPGDLELFAQMMEDSSVSIETVNSWVRTKRVELL